MWDTIKNSNIIYRLGILQRTEWDKDAIFEEIELFS